jgi:hypothetical protein
MKDYTSLKLKEKGLKVSWFMGRCFLVDIKTGKRISEQTHKDYDSCMFELRFLD